MRRTIITGTISATLALGIAAPAGAVPVPTYGNRWSDPSYARTHSVPCPQEDSVACYWDAAVRGNHGGASFSTLKGGKQIFWTYKPTK